MTRAILFDPATASIREVQYSDLAGIHALLKCSTIDAHWHEDGHAFYLDDEGLYHTEPNDDGLVPLTIWDGNMFVGRLLLVGPVDSEGETTDATLTGPEVLDRVRFGWGELPEPHIELVAL